MDVGILRMPGYGLPHQSLDCASLIARLHGACGRLWYAMTGYVDGVRTEIGAGRSR